MVKKVVVIGLALALIGVFLISSPSDGGTPLALSLGGLVVDFDITPDKVHEGTLIPLSHLENLFSLRIQERGEQVMVFYGTSSFTFSPGSPMIVRGGRMETLKMAPLKVNGHLLLPLSFVEDFFQIKYSFQEVDVVDPEERDLFLMVHLPEPSVGYYSGKLEVKLQLINKTHGRELISFTSGQRFDLFLHNEKGEKVYTWSHGRFFTQAMGSLDLGPGEETSFIAHLDLSSLPAGSYELTGIITGRKRSDQSPIESRPISLMIR